ncbi:hypothetical protein LTS15_004390 [Exophiala xenobiotica]|nr:hypothetical protein LTS15_004390 [Exophiala xenobiotica]
MSVLRAIIALISLLICAEFTHLRTVRYSTTSAGPRTHTRSQNTGMPISMLIPYTSSRLDASPTHTLDLVKVTGVSQFGEDSHLQRWSSFIGIITAIIGNLLISFALNTQRYAHILIERNHNGSRKSHPNGIASTVRTGYGTDQQEQIAEARRKANLGLPDRKEHTAEDSTASADVDVEGGSESPTEEPRHKSEPENEDEGRPSYLKSPVWWLGLVLMIIGEAGNFLAYGFAPASIVSPLGVVALISNCMIAPLMLKERFRKRDFFGVLVAVAGAVIVVLSAESSEEKFGPGGLLKTIKRWEFLVYVIITTLFIVALMYAEPRYGRRTILVDLGLVALFGGYTALSTKGVSSLLSTSLWKAFAYPIFYFLVTILVLSALMQIRYLNRALQIYDSTQVIPTQFVLFTLSVILGSAVLYRDFEHTTPEQAVKFVIGCLLTFFGVYLITSRREGYTDIDEREADEDEAIQLIDEEADGVDERTPLTRDRKASVAPGIDDHHSVLETVEESEDEATTPQHSLRPASSIPSIAFTPAESSDGLQHNPWSSSAEQIDAPPSPRTPLGARVQSESSTPFFTPFTSKLLKRSISSPAGPETTSKQGTPRLPSPARHERPAEDPTSTTHFLSRSTRGSISRLIPVPGPLLPPLSSSLSALVADSLLRGEGASRSVRASIRRSRSSRHSIDSRRQTIPVSDPENPLGMNFQNRSEDQSLSRAQTHEGAVGEDHTRQDDMGKQKRRLRALSETFSGIMGRGKGKKPDDDVEDSRADRTSGV